MTDEEIRSVLEWEDHPVLEIPTGVQVVSEGWDAKRLIDYHKKYHEAIQAELDDPYRYGMELDNWKKMDELIKSGVTDLLVQGGNRCLAPEQDLYDPQKGISTPISQIHTDTTVLAWNGSHLVPAKASKPFRKKKDRLYRVTLEGGSSFSCSGAHRLLLATGEYEQLDQLKIGSLLCHPQSTSDTDLLLYPSDDLHSSGVSHLSDNQYISSSIKHNNTIRVVKVDYLRDDYVWDLTVPKYGNYWCEGVIHHNSGKTEVCAKRVVQAAMHNPNSIIWCFQTTYENSIQMQQKAIWKYIPKELKGKSIRSTVTYISYTQKRGFSDGKLVFPNGSEIVFRNYSQDISTIEGGEIGCMKPVTNIPFVHNIGFWADELIPQDFLDTLRFRLITRNAVGLISFTAIQGYTPVVRDYMAGAKTIETKKAELLDNEDVPYIQQPVGRESKKDRSAMRIIYFHTKDNPYNDYERLRKDLDGAPREEIMCRAYGVPEKPLAGKFPKFSHKHNVIKEENLPWVVDPDAKVTHYMVIDPAGDKPWFMIWAGVTPLNEVYIWAEYPDAAIEGMWADMSKGKRGRPGPGAKGNGFGFEDYKRIIEEVEKDKTMFERLIDPRMGANKYQKEEMTTDIINELSLIGIHTIPAPGYDEDPGIQSINDLLAWDDRKPLTLSNKPKLYITERCDNLIYAMTEYTGELGSKEPTKDPIDCVRYLCIADAQYLDENDSITYANR